MYIISISDKNNKPYEIVTSWEHLFAIVSLLAKQINLEFKVFGTFTKVLEPKDFGWGNIDNWVIKFSHEIN